MNAGVITVLVGNELAANLACRLTPHIWPTKSYCAGDTPSFLAASLKVASIPCLVHLIVVHTKVESMLAVPNTIDPCPTS
jgi:hypothetical protein